MMDESRKQLLEEIAVHAFVYYNVIGINTESDCGRRLVECLKTYDNINVERFKLMQKKEYNLKNRKLGKTQTSVLYALKEHKSWSSGCGWIWTTHKQTEKILNTLVSRGLVRVETKNLGLINQHPTKVYYPVEQ